MTGAQFEIRIDGTPQQITYAMELAVVQSSDLVQKSWDAWKAWAKLEETP